MNLGALPLVPCATPTSSHPLAPRLTAILLPPLPPHPPPLRLSAGGSPATGEEQARAAGGVEGSGVGGEDAAGMGRERGDERGAMEEGLQGGDGGGGGDGGTSVRVEDEEEDEEEDDAARKGKKSERVEEPSGLRGFHPSQRILLVGEGDFSFTRALLRLMAPARPLALFATALDSRHTIVQVRPRAPPPHAMPPLVAAPRCTGRLCICALMCRALMCRVAAGKRRRKGKANPLEKPFDRIVFNFPHVGLGIKDERINVQRNRQLLFDFFVSAAPLLAPQGEVRVSLRTGHPYSLWNAPALAEESRALRLKFTHRFHRDDFPGYAHRRTIGGKTGLMVENTEEGSKAAGAKTFVFCHRNAHLPRSANAGVAGRKKMR
ncbi:unnamed protein product [Closterium sp. Yama58-4]|nr:unnamed protein product [Closterium sp. Yama58-4]